MNVLPLPEFAFQAVAEFGYNFLVDKLTANDLDQIGEYLYKPIGFNYEKVVLSAQKLARKLIADPGDKMVNFLKFDNYVVPLDVALGGYFMICEPFISYTRLVDEYSESKKFDFITTPEIVVPKRIYQLVNGDDKSDEFSIRVAILKIAKELNHPALDNDYQKRVWSIIEHGLESEIQRQALATSMNFLLKNLKIMGIPPSDGTPIRQYWWRALFGHFNIDEDRFTARKGEIGELLLFMKDRFAEISRQTSYRNNTLFRDRANSVVEYLKSAGINLDYIHPPYRPSKAKFRDYKGSNLEKEFQIGIKKKYTEVKISDKPNQELEPLSLRRYTNEEVRFIRNFRTGHNLDDFLKYSRFDDMAYVAQSTASDFMYKVITQLDDEDILRYKPVIRILAQERSFEDLINCNIMYPKLRFGYYNLIFENKVEHVYKLLNLDIPYKSTFTRERRLRIFVEQDDRNYFDSYTYKFLKHSIRCSWIPIMGELLKLETAISELRLIEILYRTFEWGKFAKSKTGMKLVRANKNNSKFINRLRSVIDKFGECKNVKIPIEFKDLMY